MISIRLESGIAGPLSAAKRRAATVDHGQDVTSETRVIGRGEKLAQGDNYLGRMG